MAKLKILCIHGIGDLHTNPDRGQERKTAIEVGLRRRAPIPGMVEARNPESGMKPEERSRTASALTQ